MPPTLVADVALGERLETVSLRGSISSQALGGQRLVRMAHPTASGATNMEAAPRAPADALATALDMFTSSECSRVGCAVRTIAYPCGAINVEETGNVRLPPRPGSGCLLFLHPGDPPAPARADPAEAARSPAPGHRPGASALSLHYCWLGAAARSPALPVADARGRCRLRPALVADQAVDQPGATPRAGGDQPEPLPAPRVRTVTAALLGTPHPR